MDTRPLATDAVILLDGQVVLLERAHPPYEGDCVLPGGFVEPRETAREACIRETRGEVDLAVDPVAFVGLFDAPDRDERGTVSAAYLCRPTEPGQSPAPREEASAIRLADPAALPAMGFDHEAIVQAAVSP